MLARRVERMLAASLLVLFMLPLVSGFAGTLLPALGYFDIVASGNGFAVLLADPRMVPAIIHSLFIGLVSTGLVLLLTIIALVCVYESRLWLWISSSLPPLLAVPHAALAVGLLFLIAPSGAIVRLISPELTSWVRPPGFWVVPDSGGWTLILGLVIKETPFLLLTAAAQLATLKVDASLRIGRTLGYSPARCWSRLILPRLYPRIRLTLLIIMAFNLTVVDMAILLGPSSPPTLAVVLMSLINDPGSRAAASAGAIVLVALVGCCFLILWQLETFLAHIARSRRKSGVRGKGLRFGRRIGQMLVGSLLLICSSSLLVIVIWSFTHRWRFPNIVPTQWTLENWSSRVGMLLQPAGTTLSIALTVTILSLLSAVMWLELERRQSAIKIDSIWLLPLLIPQVSLLFGWQVVALWTGSDGTWLMVIYTHWLYTFPYVVLILAVAWRELDPQWSQAAHSLGVGYWRVLWQVRLPLLRKPICQAAAVAFAVSVAQYLPTLLLGAGRYPTLATELVTSFGGVDRRVIATLAVLQSLLPLLAFVLALVYPVWRSSLLKSHSGSRLVLRGVR